MAIQKTNDYFKIDTVNTTLLFKAYAEGIHTVYYGKKLSDAPDYNIIATDAFRQRINGSSDSLSKVCMPYSSPGCGNDYESLVMLINCNGSRVNRFKYTGFSIHNGKAENTALPSAYGAECTLEIQLYDDVAMVGLNQYYSVYPSCDVITVRQTLVNHNAETLKIERCLSVQMDIHGTGYTVTSLDGAWCRERNINRHILDSGIHAVQSRLGASSNKHNPFVMLSKEKESRFYAFNLVYSGNHLSVAEAENFNFTRFLSGINDFQFEWELSGGERFDTPEAVMLFAENENAVIHGMHKFISNHIVPPQFKNFERPIVFNNWEGTHFDFDKEKIASLAEKAAKLGIELFVLDDGWFGARNNDLAGLGDWTDNKEKLGGGLWELSEAVRKKGMKFGIWVEMEMVSEDSDLFKKHPEYAMRIPGREPIRRRHQLMLDLVNPKVQEFIYKAVSDIIKRSLTDYVKWDFNRVMSDMYSSELTNQGEYCHRYQMALYSILKKLTEAFPKVLFESCASGGNRYDLGMLCYMPQTWASDNTDPLQRVFIQQGTLLAYPQHTMGAHVSLAKTVSGANISMETRFNIAAIGAFGYEMDFEKCRGGEFLIMSRQIAFYKKHRKLLQFGNCKKIKGLHDNQFGLMTISSDKRKAIAILVINNEIRNTLPLKWRFTGLDDKTYYKVVMRPQADVIEPIPEFNAFGDVLNNCFLDFGSFFKTQNDAFCTAMFQSRMFIIEKIQNPSI